MAVYVVEVAQPCRTETREKGEVQDKISLKEQANFLELGSTFLKFPNIVLKYSNIVPKAGAYLINTLAS